MIHIVGVLFAYPNNYPVAATSVWCVISVTGYIVKSRCVCNGFFVIPVLWAAYTFPLAPIPAKAAAA